MISVVGSMLLGLIFTGRKADSLFALSAAHLDSEILRQFREDGGNFESAIHYHQLSLEAVLVALCSLRAAAGANFCGARSTYWISAEVEVRIEKGINLVSDYINAFGCSPQFGDSSDTRILIHRDYFDWNPLDHSFIADLAGIAFPNRECFSPSLYHDVYPRSGYGFFSSKRYGVCFNASPVSEDEHGGHNHCDKASFVLRIHDKPVLVDSGTYCYTPDILLRYEHRRTGSHNLVIVDGCEQASMNPKDVFQTPVGIGPSIRYEGGNSAGLWIMRHVGYSRLPGVGAVTRTVRCLEDRIEIEEMIDGSGEHTIEVVYQLFPGIEYRHDEDTVLLTKDGFHICSLEIPEHYRFIGAKGLYSSAYLETRTAIKLILSRQAVLPEKTSYTIVIQ
jgi:hypothetical protein